METIAVIDFETTGLGPTSGGRATEIAAVLVRNGTVVDAWSSLMNSGAWVPPYIQALTGISNEMLASAPDSVEYGPSGRLVVAGVTRFQFSDSDTGSGVTPRCVIVDTSGYPRVEARSCQ